MFDQALGQICSIVSDFSVNTLPSIFWTVIKYTIAHYWYVIIPVLLLFVIWELGTRGQSGFGYKSANGFSPLFNILVGSLVYALNYELLSLVFSLFVGDYAACIVLMGGLHPIVFTATWIELIITGFWVY
jgi:hypothetical protein